MGTFAGYFGKLSISEEKRPELAERMLKLFTQGGMMNLDSVKVMDVEVELLSYHTKRYLISSLLIRRLVTSKVKRGSTVQDYMRALKERFDTHHPQDVEMREEADGLFHELCSVLGKNDCKKLVRLVDIEDARRGKAELNNFISGFKLAWGIFRELTDEPPYSFEEEQEQRARRLFMESLQRE